MRFYLASRSGLCSNVTYNHYSRSLCGSNYTVRALIALNVNLRKIIDSETLYDTKELLPL